MEELADFAVDFAQKLGADYAEARFQVDYENLYVLRNGNPEAVSWTRRRGIGIRVMVDGAFGFASVNELEKSRVENCVREAVSMARAASKTLKQPLKLSEEEAHEDSWRVEPKTSFLDVSLEEKMGYLLEIDKRIADEQEIGVKIPQRLMELTEVITEKYFVNSDGAHISSWTPRVYFMAFLTAYEGGRTEQEFVERGEARGWEALKDWNLPELLVERSKLLGRIIREAQPPPREKVDLVLGSQVVGLIVHESAGHPYEADRIFGREAAQAGESFLKADMLGQRIGSEVVNVADDPTLEHSYGFYLYDDEGVKARRRLLIKDGIINEFLHNRETAARMGIKSNASARANAFDREPIVRMANTFMLPGDRSFEELLEDIRLGVYIKTFGEWNIDDRRYNLRFVGRECYLIENGELKGLVRRPILEVTTPGLYASIDALDGNLSFEAATCGKGDPVQGIPVWHGGPNVRVRGIEVWR